MLTKQKPPARASTGGAYRTNFSRSLTRGAVEFNEVLPHDSEAEDGVLQACLADPQATDRAGLIIQATDFYFKGNAEIFTRLVQFRNQNRSYTPTTVIESFRNHKDRERLEERVLNLGPFFTGGTASHFAKVVKDYSVRRQVIAAALKMIEDALAIVPSVEEIEEQFLSTVQHLRLGGSHA